MAVDLISRVVSSVKYIMSGSKFLQKRKIEDVHVLLQLKVSVPVLKEKPWIITRWICPRVGRVKLNSDGCCKINPGSGGRGSILRDNGGQVIFAHTDFYEDTTNSVAKAKALLQGLKLCQARHIDHIDIEVDSLMLQQAISKKIATPWVIMYETRQINAILQQMDHCISHVYRKNNRAADFLANWGVKERKFVIFNRMDFPRKLIGIVRVDRSGLRNVRIPKT